MRDYFNNIYVGLRSFWKGLSLTFKHMKNKEELVATLQYPNEKWPIPERNIGFDMSEYNVVRSRLHVEVLGFTFGDHFESFLALLAPVYMFSSAVGRKSGKGSI